MCLFTEPTAERRKIWLPDKLHVHPGYRYGAVSRHGCPTWGVSCHSRGDLFLCSMTKLCTPTTSSMSNISVCEGQGVWDVCLRCPHLRDRSGLCQVGYKIYFCDHGKRHLSIWILPGRPIQDDEKTASLKKCKYNCQSNCKYKYPVDLCKSTTRLPLNKTELLTMVAKKQARQFHQASSLL